MAQWVKLCSVAEAPQTGKLVQLETHGVEVCLANVNGVLRAMDAWCPHRHGPLAEGWIEGDRVVCPWHAWGFEVATGHCPEERAHVDVFPVKCEGEDVLVDIA